ncbi:hypothetical protein DK847_15365 [Aestuariivirga litoralis]|uniref:Uncharacterized protein n=1 Tax=Aestuariivirga litoralis TaxID=2650924 RepID=A0A2W2AKX8_9HYPH|nr:hypothetical protein [Aestuariivirga litoralis]PZF76021.1 hypothetical protein DK847_15365 [Aestuariivirga litoralis]
MKIILGIICGLVVLFAGGCALLLVFAEFTDSGAAPLALIPGGIAALNVLVLMALFGRSQPQRWAFYVLAVLDVIGAIVMAILWSSISFQVSDIWTLAVPVIGVLLLKAVLTVLVARKLPERGNPPQG